MQSTILTSRLKALRAFTLSLGILALSVSSSPVLAGPTTIVAPGTAGAPNPNQGTSTDLPPPPPPFQDGGAFGVLNPKGQTSATSSVSTTGASTTTTPMTELQRWLYDLLGIEAG